MAVAAILNPPRLWEQSRLRMVIFELLVPGYHSGSYTLEDFCRRVLAVAGKAHESDRDLLDKWVGQALRLALARGPLRRGGGRPPTSTEIKQLLADLALKVHQAEGVPLTLEGAFARVAEVCHEVGLNDVTANSVEGAYFPRPSKDGTAK